MKVAFLGPVASFSHDAALKVFPKAGFLELHSIQGVFSAVESGRADAGIVPIENSTEGGITTTLDLLLSANFAISGELFINVVHCLLAKPGHGKIKKIFSHPQAFAQCNEWLQKNYPDAELIGASSTSSAASQAVSSPNSAAIASKNAAKMFGLRVLAEGIQDLGFNKTRFIAIGKKPAKSLASNKTSMFFAVKDRPGALFDCLKGFKDKNINLTKLESRPSKKSAWDYVFFVEFEGDLSEQRVKEAMDELKKYTKMVKLLGSYPVVGD